MEEHLEMENVDSLECNICYEIHHNKNETITLECCKGSKKMCIYCIHCLTTPICPYCRCKLPSKCLLYMKETNHISVSEPNTHFTWENFLREENIIDPYTYHDSRRLRRQIRRLRHEYQQRRTRRNEDSRHSQYNYLSHSNQRQQLQNYANYVMNQYNQNNGNVYEELFIMDDC